LLFTARPGKKTFVLKSESAPALQSEQSEARHRGAVEDAAVPAGEETAPGSQNYFAKKGLMLPLTEGELRERAAEERKHEELLSKFGVSAEELAECWEADGLSGREAAFEDVGDFEHCRDLAGKFALESAAGTGDLISNVRDRYELIVEELLAVRYVERSGRAYSLSQVLLRECGTDKACKEFLEHLGRILKRFALCYFVYRLPHNTWVMPGSEVRAIKTLRGRSVSEALMKALCIEHVREPRVLSQFLCAVFKRWRSIEEPGSVVRQRLLMHQLSGTPKEIALALQEIGAVSWSTTPEQLYSARSSVRQQLSRDKRAALKRRGL
jgi:hypothetical protein